MSADASLQFRPPASLREFPPDLAAVVAAVVLTWLSLVLPGDPVAVAVRGALAVGFVLLAPGYALVSALFPEGPEADRPVERRRAPDDVERFAFAVGVSVVAAPLVALAVYVSPFDLTLASVVVPLSALTLTASVVAAGRRASLPVDERYAPPTIVRDAVRARSVRPVDVVVVVALLVAAGSLGYAAANPRVGESFTEFYVLAEGEDGALVADNYPGGFTLGESAPLVVGLENREGARQAYTVVVVLQAVDADGAVTQQRELDRFRADLADDETWRLEHEVTPSFAGDRLRLAYLLYYGDAPAAPSFENADDHVHIWVSVDDTGPEA